MTQRKLSILILLIALFASPLTASAQGDLGLLSTSIPPNVMILFDNSGSMNHVLWEENFDPKVFYDNGAAGGSGGWGCTNNLGSVPSISGSTGDCPASGDPAGTCPNNEASAVSGMWCRYIPGGCSASYPAGFTCDDYYGGGWYLIMFPDYTADNQWTRFSENYLFYLFENLYDGTPMPMIPNQTRLESAKVVITNVVNNVNPDLVGGGYQENVRFGVTTFDTNTSNNNGGYVRVPINSSNKTTLLTYVTGISGVTWTPLSETLVDIGRYFAGSDGLGGYSVYNRSDNTGSIPSSPIDEYCRNSFVVVMTDGEPTKDLNDHHGGTFMSTIGNADGDTNESPDPISGRTDAPPYQSNGTDWLDDVSWYLKNTDLVSDSNFPDAPAVEEVQDVVTFTVGFVIDHPLLKDTADNATGKYFTTGQADQLEANLTAAIQDILQRNTSFSAASVPTSRSAFDDTFFGASFLPDPVDAFWEGHVRAYKLDKHLNILGKNGTNAIDPVTHRFLEPASDFYFWDASTEMMAQIGTRNLYTTKSGVKTLFDTVNMTATDLGIVVGDLTIYDPNDPFASTEAVADAMVNYLQGADAFDKDSDGLKTEDRDRVLGDVFHSNPVLIGAPPSLLAREAGFGPATTNGTFLYEHKDRPRKLIFGANDGMIHALNAGTFHADDPNTPGPDNGYYDIGDENPANGGQEAFGYVPGFLLDKLKKIPLNLPRSEYYVDGNPIAADVWYPDPPTDPNKLAAEWKTTVMIGMREGGAGYVALDVTDPDDPNYPKLLFEYSDTATTPLGDTWSEPIITRVKIKTTASIGDRCGIADGDGNCREQWVAIFGGGYRDDGDPNLASYVSDPNSGAWSNKSKGIYIVALGGPRHGQILDRVDYGAIAQEIDGARTEPRMTFSIPSTPAVFDLDFDGFADIIYVGDLGGQLWKWDLSEIGDEDSITGLIENWPVDLFFTPREDASLDPGISIGGVNKHYHSIFFAPSASYIDNELVIVFMSGERTDIFYEGSGTAPQGTYDDNNRLWVVWDRSPTDPNVYLNEDPIKEGITLDALGKKHGLNDITGLDADSDTDDDGYYLTVPDGEKFIVNSLIFNGFLLTLSYVPDNDLTQVCDRVGFTNLWLFRLKDGQGQFDQDLSGNTNDDARRARLGNGAPTDPRVSVADDGTVKLIGQTSLGDVHVVEIGDAPPPVALVYWRQTF